MAKAISTRPNAERAWMWAAGGRNARTVAALKTIAAMSARIWNVVHRRTDGWCKHGWARPSAVVVWATQDDVGWIM